MLFVLTVHWPDAIENTAAEAHVLDPAAEVKPAEQAVHVDDEIAPKEAEKFPAAQLVQLEELLLAAYVPEGQSEHGVNPDTEKVPDEQGVPQILAPGGDV